MTAAMIAIIVLAAGLIAAGGTAVALALTRSKIDRERDQALLAKRSAEANWQHVLEEAAQEREKTDAHLELLRAELKELEDELERCNVPGATRARLQRLLSKDPAAGDPGAAAEAGVSGEGGASPNPNRLLEPPGLRDR